jgi:hypothetical protein
MISVNINKQINLLQNDLLEKLNVIRISSRVYKNIHDDAFI